MVSALSRIGVISFGGVTGDQGKERASRGAPLCGGVARLYPAQNRILFLRNQIGEAAPKYSTRLGLKPIEAGGIAGR